MTIDLTSIANAIVALIAAIITAFVIPYIKSKTTTAQFEKIKMWVTVAVEAAKQLYTGSGRGAEKKAYVVEFLNSKGFEIDADTLDKLIEAAVFNLPEAGKLLLKPIHIIFWINLQNRPFITCCLTVCIVSLLVWVAIL